VHNDFAWWEGFIGVYLETMRRVGATRRYFFSRDYFADLKQALGSRLHLWSVHSPQGALAAASIFIETDGIVQFHLGGTAAEFSSFAPAKLLMYDVGKILFSAINRVFLKTTPIFTRSGLSPTNRNTGN
jgi:hypothetical protein